MIHHIAIGTLNLESMTIFYSKLPCLKFIEWKYDFENKKRSSWFHTTQNILLMLELKEKHNAPEALIFQYIEDYNYFITKELIITEKSKSTLYFYDPDGNKLGFSCFPNLLPNNFNQ